MVSVCLKALARDPLNRYETVEELRSEIVAYLNGFATQAEDASYFKMLYLLIRRHKVPFSLTVLFLFFLGLTFSFYQNRLVEEERKISQLNISKARVLYNRADNDYKSFQIKDAYKDITDSLELNTTVRSRSLLGKIYLVLGEYKKAKEIYESFETDEEATNRIVPILKRIDFSEDLNYFHILTNELLKVHLPGVVFFMVKYKHDQIENLDEKLEAARELLKIFNGQKAKFSLEFEDDDLVFKGSPSISRLMPLVGLPIKKIDLSSAVLYDITSLRGMKTLRYLDLTNTYVEKLQPLDGLTLDYLSVKNTCVVDLGVLKNTKVKLFDMRGQKVKYLTGLLKLTNIEKILIDEDRYISHKDRRELKELKKQNRIMNE